MPKYRIFLILLILFFSNILFSGDSNIKFDRLSREDGLSSSTIYSIVEDHKGFLWFGTPDGLNKFDGHSFRVFKNNLNNKNSIPNSSAGNLLIDSDGLIWIGTWGGGLIQLDPKLETFKSYKNDTENDDSISGNRVQSLFRDKSGSYWFGTYQEGLNKFDLSNEKFTSFKKSEEENSISHNRIWSIQEDPNENLWIGTSEGLNLFNKEDNSFTRIKGTENYTIRNILIPDDNHIWFGTDEGLYIYDIESDVIKDTDFKDKIYALFEDRNHILWIGTAEGLIRYDYRNNRFRRFTHIPENQFSLSINKIRTIFEDSSGIIWIGTDGGGLCRFNNNPHDITHYYSDKSKSSFLLDNNVFAFEESEDSQIWLGTKKGLQKWDMNTNEFTTYFDGEIRALERADTGDLWIGSRSGLFRYDSQNDKIFTYNFSIDEIRSLIIDSNNTLWIGTYKNGVYTYDETNGEIINYLPGDISDKSINHKEIWVIFEDSQGDIWIGTGNGLNRKVKGSNSFISYKYDESDNDSLLGYRVYSIFEDKNQNIWIGTDEGLNQWYRKSDSFARLSTDEGLADKSVKSIVEDFQGNLWLGSNDGLTKYNRERGSSFIYSLEHNIQGREFHVGSIVELKDGSILMGGLDGFNHFYPENIGVSSYKPPVVLSEFLVKGERKILDYSTEYIENIKLNYRENFFTFKFIALDYSPSSRNSYSYKLEGVDENWIFINDRNYVSYTNIEGGEYTFRVKAANTDQIWNDDELVIHVSVESPPWKQWWAYFSYTSIILAIVAVILSWRLKQHRNEISRHKEFVEKLEENVLERTIELKLVNKKLERLSSIDDLTSLYNRRYFGKRYISEWSRLQRVNLPISVLMCDIDHFKLYNDYYGHQAGDRCIKDVARIISEHCVRPTDIAVRYGGEEFLVILPQTDVLGAMKVAGSIKKSINEEAMKHEYSPTASHITISIGVSSEIPDSDVQPMSLVEKADKALYECKNNGRNKIFLYSNEMNKMNKTR